MTPPRLLAGRAALPRRHLHQYLARNPFFAVMLLAALQAVPKNSRGGGHGRAGPWQPLCPLPSILPAIFTAPRTIWIFNDVDRSSV
jgi:hypothetical protein